MISDIAFVFGITAAAVILLIWAVIAVGGSDGPC